MNLILKMIQIEKNLISKIVKSFEPIFNTHLVLNVEINKNENNIETEEASAEIDEDGKTKIF